MDVGPLQVAVSRGGARLGFGDGACDGYQAEGCR
ncbi:MAG: hypothetical protein QOF34_795 [Sphingomonadales bacterium]|jgi:hypothetical protein|nr:hypothetical protein [Sphingomonadales bacterium]